MMCILHAYTKYIKNMLLKHKSINYQIKKKQFSKKSSDI